MGNDARQRAWTYSGSQGERLALLALAEHIPDQKHTCWPSHETLAGMVGVSERHLKRLLQSLEQHGAIVMKIGQGRGHTTLYGLLIGLTDDQQNQVRRQIKGDAAMSPFSEEKVTFQTIKGDMKQDIAMSPFSEEKVTFQTIKGDIAMSPRTEKEPKEISLEERGTFFQPMFDAIARACRIDLKLCSKAQRNQVAQTAKTLCKAGKLPEEIPKVETWWYAHDWRGKKNEPPRPVQLQEVWQRATQERTNGTLQPGKHNGRHPDPRDEWQGFTAWDQDKPL